MMARRYLRSFLIGSLAVMDLATGISAAAFDLNPAKETTKALTGENRSALIGVSSAVPEEFRIGVIEIIQGLESSRDRMLLFLDRMEAGLIPPEEGMKRVRAIAGRAAQREKEFLRALLERIPAQAVPTVERALHVSSDSWRGILSALQVRTQEKERPLPSRPGFGTMVVPGPFGAPRSSE